MLLAKVGPKKPYLKSKGMQFVKCASVVDITQSYAVETMVTDIFIILCFNSEAVINGSSVFDKPPWFSIIVENGDRNVDKRKYYYHYYCKISLFNHFLL